ncbi:MAG: MFS transporter [Polymorphobacter sp.]|uniref:MFS transporter n=1 Tax=Polymorphobacter sp. TaxID=1909290 RepID=UPI003A870F93
MSQGVAIAAPRSGEAGLTHSTCFNYGVGTIALAILLNTVSTYFPAFMSTVLGQTPALAGLLLTGSKLYDIIVDLFVGSRIDRASANSGTRRRLMLIGGLGSGLGFILLFSVSIEDQTWLIIAIAALLVGYSTAYSMFNVPYVAMAPRLANDYDDRTRLMSWRTFFSAAGQLTAIAGAATLVKMGDGGAGGYQLMGGVLGTIIIVSMLFTTFTVGGAAETPLQDEVAGAPARVGFLVAIGQIWSNRPAILLLSAKTLQYISLSCNISTGLLFKLNVLRIGYEGQAEFGLAQNLTMAVSMPLWLAAGRRFGKRNCYLFAIGLYALVMLSWLAADASIGPVGLLGRASLQGLGAGGMILMSLAMLPDVMDNDAAQNGRRRDGIYSSVYAIIEKAGFAIGAGLMGVYLSASGYVATTRGQLVEQAPEAIRALYAGSAVFPAILLTASFIIMLFYRLDKRTLDTTKASGSRPRP